MKNLIALILIFSTFKGFSQAENAVTLRNQVDKLNSVIVLLKDKNKSTKDSLASVLNQNLYLRESLNIFESEKQVVIADKVEFSLLSCKSNKGTNSVTLEFLIVNKDVNKTIQFTPVRFGNAIDLQGNAYKPSDIKIGTEKYASTLFKDVPLKLTITFSGIDTSVKLLKLVNLQFFTPPTKFKQTDVIFKDITIQ